MSLIDQNYFFIDYDADSKEEIFKEIGQKLIEENIVKENYVEAILEREEEFPTGLPLSVGVAIPHTDGIHVNEDKLIFITLKNPVEFCEMGGDPEDIIQVNCIIMIIMADGKSHLSILQNIIAGVQDETFINKLMQEKDKAKMEALIKNHIPNLEVVEHE